MTIHVVLRGETLDSIATDYKISKDLIIKENELENPANLVEGQTLVISYPSHTYTIKDGDTLNGIAEENGITLMELLRNNPYLSDQEYIYPGQTIVIRYDETKVMQILTNGYAYPFIDIATLKKTLPFLTYLTIFNYTVTAQGDLNDIDDEAVIQTAKAYGVAPIMLISTNTGEGTLNTDISHAILNSADVQNHLADNVLSVMKSKGYYGVNIDSLVVLPEDRQQYVNFVDNFTKRFNEEGYQVFATITPSTFEVYSGIIYPGIDYTGLGQAANSIAFLHYSWGYTNDLPLTMIPFNSINKNIAAVATLIPPQKIQLGITSIGYIYELPYTVGESSVQFISYPNAIQLAIDTNSIIQFDANTQGSFFFINVNNKEYFIWFREARGIDNFLKLVPRYHLQGTAIWNIMYYLAQMMTVINSQYDIEKVL